MGLISLIESSPELIKALSAGFHDSSKRWETLKVSSRGLKGFKRILMITVYIGPTIYSLEYRNPKVGCKKRELEQTGIHWMISA